MHKAKPHVAHRTASRTLRENRQAITNVTGGVGVPDDPGLAYWRPNAASAGSPVGHSSVALTLDSYSHVIDGMDREAAETVACLIGGGR
jgi:hypothetical protein